MTDASGTPDAPGTADRTGAGLPDPDAATGGLGDPAALGDPLPAPCTGCSIPLAVRTASRWRRRRLTSMGSCSCASVVSIRRPRSW